VERRLLLDVVVAQRAAVLELLAGEDEALLVGRDALLVLDLLLDVVDRVARLDVECDGLAREGLDEDLRWGRARSVVASSSRGVSRAGGSLMGLVSRSG
jgi:hypothetical protein